MGELQASTEAAHKKTTRKLPHGENRERHVAGQEKLAKPRDSALRALAAIESMRTVNSDAQNTAITLAMSGEAAVRLKTVDVLAGMGTRAARDAVVALLRDANLDVRERAIITAGVYKMAEAVSPLRALLNDPVTRVALLAAGALGKIGDTSGLRLVTRILEEDCPESRLAARAVGDITGHRFAANREGVAAARRYLDARASVLTVA